MRIIEARMLADVIVSKLRKEFPEARAEVCGSIRRRKPEVKDIDILIDTDVSDFFDKLGQRQYGGDSDSQIIVDGMKVDLRIVPPDAWPAAMIFLTGSSEFNIWLRTKAKKLNMKLNRYGLYHRDTGLPIPLLEEKDVFHKLGLLWISPEERSVVVW